MEVYSWAIAIYDENEWWFVSDSLMGTLSIDIRDAQFYKTVLEVTDHIEQLRRIFHKYNPHLIIKPVTAQFKYMMPELA